MYVCVGLYTEETHDGRVIDTTHNGQSIGCQQTITKPPHLYLNPFKLMFLQSYYGTPNKQILASILSAPLAVVCTEATSRFSFVYCLGWQGVCG